MKLDIKNLLEDYHISFQTEGHKHCRPGWINVECPFCSGNPGYHLGFNLQYGYFSCWRCGGKKTYEVLSKLLGIPLPEARVILKEYSGFFHYSTKESKIKPRIKAFKYPNGTEPISKRQIKYLKSRGFNIEYLKRVWKIESGTGPIGKLDNSDYKHRIIIPIIWQNKIVSFQARDFTGKSELKYKACPKDRELIHHKDIVYMHPDINKDKTVIIVEGILDVWKLGIQAIATFGIKYTKKQMLFIRRNFRKAVIIFDNESEAQKQANKLAGELQIIIPTKIMTAKTDPGDLTRNEAKALLEEIE